MVWNQPCCLCLTRCVTGRLPPSSFLCLPLPQPRLGPASIATMGKGNKRRGGGGQGAPPRTPLPHHPGTLSGSSEGGWREEGEKRLLWHIYAIVVSDGDVGPSRGLGGFILKKARRGEKWHQSKSPLSPHVCLASTGGTAGGASSVVSVLVGELDRDDLSLLSGTYIGQYYLHSHITPYHHKQQPAAQAQQPPPSPSPSPSPAGGGGGGGLL